MKRYPGLDTGLALILNNSPNEELDYGFVMACLKDYNQPRVKLNHLLKINALIRVKKGIYIIGAPFARRPYSREILANMIYGPSYVSLEWACQYYRLIPERVTTITSVTTQRSRQFRTPVGLFTYTHLPLKIFPVGATWSKLYEDRYALIATKEKALADLLMLRRGRFNSKKQMQRVLFEDLRIEEDDIKGLDLENLKAIYQQQPHSALKYLIKCRES